MPVLLFADSFITFPEEVERIWKRRFTGATVVFLITRYVAVAERITLVVSVFLPTLQDKVRWRPTKNRVVALAVLRILLDRGTASWLSSEHVLTRLSSCVPVLRLDDTLTDISYLMFGSACRHVSRIHTPGIDNAPVFMMLRARGIWGRGWFPIALLAFLTPVRTIVTIVSCLRGSAPSGALVLLSMILTQSCAR